MLKKLLKYDLKWVLKPLVVFYILAIFFSLVIRVIESLDNSLIVLIIDRVSCGTLISVIFSIIFNCLMRNWVRFVRNIYKDESYLTQTLPVSRSNILLSKVLTIIITLFISLLVIIISLCIAILNNETLLILKDNLNLFASYLNISITTVIIVFFIIIFLELLYIVLSGILGIILGHKSNDLKIVKSIIYAFLIYVSLSVLSLLIIYVMGLFNEDLMSVFSNTSLNIKTIKTIIIMGIALYSVYNIVLYLVSSKLLNNGVDVD